MIKKLLKIFLIIPVVSLLVNISSATAQTVQNVPAFNNLPGDQEFLRGKNVSQNQAELSDPIEASGGETVRGVIYYHNTAQGENGAPGEAAQNVRIKINLPTTVTSSHLMTGQIAADNAATVTGTIVNGQEVGQPGLTVNTPTGPTTLDFISDSVKWFPEGATNPVALPFGQSGDELMTGNGLNLGDIFGCWQFAGFVTFDLRIKPSEAGQPIFVKGKLAFNESQNVEAQTVNAKAGDVIRYVLRTGNSGTGPGQIEVSDDIADILEFANVIDTGQGTLTGSIISFGTITLNPTEQVDKLFIVKVKDPLPTTGDFIMTNVYGNQVIVKITPPPVIGQAILQIDKQVRNKTDNTDFLNGVTANRDELVEYRIIIRNRQGANPALNVQIRDLLQTGLTFVPGTGRINFFDMSFPLPGDLFDHKGNFILNPFPEILPIGQGDTLTIFFQAKVNNDLANNTQLRNYVTAKAENSNEVGDEVIVLVKVPSQPQPPVQPPTQQPPVIIQPPIAIPKTGPAAGLLMMLGISSSAATFSHYFKAKKALRKALINKNVL